MYDNYSITKGRRDRDRKVVRCPTIYMQSVYSIQHYVITFFSDLWQVDGFLRARTSVSSTNKTDLLDITELLYTVALNTITIVLF
jgi:hypothetical protein